MDYKVTCGISHNYILDHSTLPPQLFMDPSLDVRDYLSYEAKEQLHVHVPLKYVCVCVVFCLAYSLRYACIYDVLNFSSFKGNIKV